MRRIGRERTPTVTHDNPARRGIAAVSREPLLELQGVLGNQVVQRLLRGQAARPTARNVERAQGAGSIAPVAHIHRRDSVGGIVQLDALLERFDVPEEQVIALLPTMSRDEQLVVLSMEAYRSKFAAALTNEEMARAVDALKAPLRLKLEWMLAEGTSYELVKPRIVAASPADRAAVLDDHDLLRALRDGLLWHNFAKCVELLGKSAPDRATLLADPDVQVVLDDAWVTSNPGVRTIPVTEYIHEEGGWVYFDVITGALSFERRSGGPDSTSDRFPPAVEDSIVVATFHTHPQLGADFERTPSDADIATGQSNGVPGIIRTEEAGEKAFYFYGPDVRPHLAGSSAFRSWSFPRRGRWRAPLIPYAPALERV